MANLLAVSFVAACLVPPVLFGGLVSISRRNVKRHQLWMLVAFGLFSVSLFSYWTYSYSRSAIYTGGFPEAFGLLFWLQLGLGVAGWTLGAVTLWAVMENVWELHRRTGMFTVFSASVSSVLTLIMILMSWTA